MAAKPPRRARSREERYFGLTLAQWAQACGVPPDSKVDPRAAILAAPGVAAILAHDREARQLLPKVCELMRNHLTALRALLERPLPRQPDKTYRTVQANYEKLYPSGPLTWRDLMGAKKRIPISSTTEYRIQTTGEFFDAWVREYEEQVTLGLALLEKLQALAPLAPAQPLAGSTPGPMADDELIAAARNVHAMCVARGIPNPRQATVQILEDLGWDLGPGTRLAKSERLRKRATKKRATKQR
jgi:hypothetical protein